MSATLSRAILARRVEIGGGDALDQVEPARLQIGQPHRRIGDRQKGDAVEIDRVLVPVVGKALEHDAVLRHPLDEFVGPGADRVIAELGAGFGRLGRHDHAGAVAELRQQRRERRRQHELDGVVVDDLDLARPR